MQSKRPKLPIQQLFILAICRFAEPVVITSILPYLPEMIEHVGVPKNEVGKWVGIASAVTACCQGSTSVLWGMASDHVGRKPIVLLGLTCTMVFSVLFGFSQTLPLLVLARALVGLMNGNMGILRTMVAEMVPEKELQPRAFSFLPLVWTIGCALGPAFGGSLAHPVEKHPEIFGRLRFLKEYPFALPNLAAACLFLIGIITGFLFMRETLAARKDKRDYGLLLGQTLTRQCTLRRKSASAREHGEDERTPLLGDNARQLPSQPKNIAVKKPSWKQVFSPQSNVVLLAYGTLGMHTMAFDSMFPVFLHHPVQQLQENPDVQLPFKFIGGFGMDSQTIGIFYTLIGIFGMLLQFITFPWAARIFGIRTCLRFASVFFPIVYSIVPFIALIPEPFRKIAVCIIMFCKLAAVTFAFPCCTILLTNSAASPSVLGTLNGIGTGVTAFGRAVGPALVGASFSLGVNMGYIIIPWWILTLFGVISALPTFWMVESNGLGKKGERESDVRDEEQEQQAEAPEGGTNGVRRTCH